MEPELQTWAREALAARKTLRTLLGTAGNDALNPAVLVSVAAARVFRPDTPVEVFSDAPAPGRKRSRLVPIDGLLAEYSREDRTIRIFPKRIAAAADAKLRCAAADVEAIVRIHMYARAVLHAATSADDDHTQLSDYPAGAETDWAQFLERRSRAFAQLDGGLLGMLANAITWKIVKNAKGRPTLRSAFRRVMRRQPENERVPLHLLRGIGAKTDLAPVFEYAQGEYDCPHPGTFDLRMRVEALLGECARPRRSPTLSPYAAADVRPRTDAAVRGPVTAGD